MFNKKVYVERRKQLKTEMKSGLILLIGNVDSPMNYPGNPYPFRQDSNFLYFFGLDKPGFTGLMDIDEDVDILYGEDFTVDDVIWMGPQPRVKELAKKIGITKTGNQEALLAKIREGISMGRTIHFLPPHRAINALTLEMLTGINNQFLKKYAANDLINAVVKLRAIKSDEEIAEIEKALAISKDMYLTVMEMAKPGVLELEITGKILGIASSQGKGASFPIILTIRGETLHNHYHGHILKEHDLLLVDSGAESLEYYASDITRTFPVGGKFTSKQKEIYEIVLQAQLKAIKAIKPKEKFREIHMKTAKIITRGLMDLGLMKGNIDEAVKQGAHALFFPHGLGHMMGLDVHDMEDLGENFVGYDKKTNRSDQFGLAYLRLARELQPGFVVTVEPGIYFIPALIDQWKSEQKHKSFINYSKVETYRDFGGIRIEDDVLVTAENNRVLGKPIPKSVAEIEKIMG